MTYLSDSTFAQVPNATNTPPAENFVGEGFCYDIVFSNSDVNPGFGPYLRIIIPPDLSLNMISFVPGGGSIISNELFPISGQLTDALIDSIVSGTPGDRMIIFEPPVGSVVQNGPDLTTSLCLDIDVAAPIGVPIPIAIQPIFRFGDVATGINGPLLNVMDTASVTPTIFTYTKTATSFEGLIPPGPSYPVTYTLTLDIANGQTINNLSFFDTLETKLQYLDFVSVTGGCTVDSTNITYAAPGGNFVVTCPSATGTTAGNDVVIQYQAYVTDILDHSQCDIPDPADTYQNNSNFTTTTQPGDNLAYVRDTALHITIEKGVNPGTVSPGETVTYTSTFEVSDYDTATYLFITDILPDGLSLDNPSVSLAVGGTGIALTTGVDLFIDLNTPGIGQTQIRVNVTDAYGANLEGPITGSLSYNAMVDQTYDTTGDPLLADDAVSSSINMAYDVLGGASGCSDGSGAGVSIRPTSIDKTLIDPLAGTFQPGDTMTYRLEMSIPSGDVDSIVFEDYFPLPVLEVVDTISITAITDPGFLGLEPVSRVIVPAQNMLEITFPNISTTAPAQLGVDVRIMISDEPFADGLFHSNILQSYSKNTPGVTSVSNDLVLIQVGSPQLSITKGISATDNTNSNISPAASTLPVDGDATNADAGDLLTYVITVENTGGADAFDVTITDTPPARLSGCTIVSVTQGDGSTAVPFTGDVFTTGLVVTDSIALTDGVANTGADMLLITYQCSCNTTVEPDEVIQNTATLSWAARPGATTFPTESDDASVTIASPSITKSIERVFPNFSGTTTDIQIGDTITYQVTVTIPEGTSPNTFLIDNLPTGLVTVT